MAMISADTSIFESTSCVLALQPCKTVDFRTTEPAEWMEAEILATEVGPTSDKQLCETVRSAGRASLDSPLAWYDGCFAPNIALHCKETACLGDVIQEDQHPVRQSPKLQLQRSSDLWASYENGDGRQSNVPESLLPCSLPQLHKVLKSSGSKPKEQNAQDIRAAAAAPAESTIWPVQPVPLHLLHEQGHSQKQGQKQSNDLHQQHDPVGYWLPQLQQHPVNEEELGAECATSYLGLLPLGHLSSSPSAASDGVPDATPKPHTHPSIGVLPALVTTHSMPDMCDEGHGWMSPSSPEHSSCRSHSSCIRTSLYDLNSTRSSSTSNSHETCFSSQPSLVTRVSLHSNNSNSMHNCIHKQHLHEQHPVPCRSLSRQSGSFQPCCSLKTALVRLEQASSKASRLMDSLNAGLMRLTSVSMAAGVLKQPVGHEILGDWEFGPHLGCGASCVTRLVVNRTTGRPAACKTINKAGMFASAAAKALIMDVQREIAIMQQVVGDPHIVQLHHVYEDARAVHLVMDWCSGGSVVDLMQRSPGGCLDERAAAAVMKSVLEVLAHCHSRGLMHRDIKPDNLLVSHILDDITQLTTDAVKVADFGISVLVPHGQVLTELAGTLDYMAPELLQRRYDQQADIWSAGVMLHELLTGRVPFEAKSCDQLLNAILSTDISFDGPCWASVSAEAKQLCSLMLSRDVELRPSAQMLLKLFSTWLQQGVTQGAT